jgi:hypothetical protein
MLTTRKFTHNKTTLSHFLTDHGQAGGGGGYGQNIGAGPAPDTVPAMITNEMYNDEIRFFL